MLWYLLILIGTFVEGEFTLIAATAGVLWSNLQIIHLVWIAWLGSFLGDILFFQLGRSHGASFKARLPKLGERMDRVVSLLAKRPLLTIFILRFQIGMRMMGNFSLGCSSMDRSRYLKLNLIACLVWSLFTTALCYYFLKYTADLWEALLQL